MFWKFFLITQFSLIFIFAHNPDYRGLDASEVHPGFDLHTIRPVEINKDINGNNLVIWGDAGTEFSAPVVGMDWMDQDLLILTWRGSSGPRAGSSPQLKTGDHPRDGRLWRVSGVQGTDRSQISGTLIADNFKDAHGVEVVSGEIYITDIDRLIKMVDNNADGFFETHELVANFPSYDGWFEYAFGLEYTNGLFYTSLGGSHDGPGTAGVPFGPDRGTFISVNPNTGTYDVIASGLREANGLAMSQSGDFFTTDNQGVYRPSSMFIHLQQGRNYGFKHEGPTFPGKYESEPVSPPAVWAVHREIGEGPTSPVEMTTGPYKGQFFAGDIGRGGVKRYFLEKVNGEYQGVIFPFTGGLESGVNRIVTDNNGVLYMGGVGNGSNSNQGWLGKKQGLQKLVPKANPIFEILALRSRKDGMELEFTQPVSNAAETVAYSVRTYTMTPVKQYGGGNKVDDHLLTVSDVQVSPDRTKVYLQVSGLQAGYVVEVSIPETFTSQSNEAVWFHHSYYTLNNISPTSAFDISGCMDPRYVEYNPNANVSDGTCKNVLALSKKLIQKIETTKTEEGLQINLPFNGTFNIELKTLSGKTVKSTIRNKDENILLQIEQNLNPGIYLLQILSHNLKVAKRVVIY